MWGVTPQPPGGEVFPRPIVVHNPSVNEQPDLARQFPAAFPACVVTRAQSSKFSDMVDLSESFLVSPICDQLVEDKVPVEPELCPSSEGAVTFPLEVGREQLAAAQKLDPSLIKCIEAAVSLSQEANAKVTYFWENLVLMRKWRDGVHADSQELFQIVLPVGYREQVLKLAHEHVLSGHLGVTKTFRRVSRYFYWPGLKSDVSNLL